MEILQEIVVFARLLPPGVGRRPAAEDQSHVPLQHQQLADITASCARTKRVVRRPRLRGVRPESKCRDFSERQAIEIRFNGNVSSVLPFEVGRTLLRILQEAVHNTVKHGGVKCVQVQLLEKTGEIHLLVTDSGRGFNVEDAMKGKGLGLTNMRERARLIHGTITIESKPMSGTTILLVRAPLGAAPLAGAA